MWSFNRTYVPASAARVRPAPSLRTANAVVGTARPELMPGSPDQAGGLLEHLDLTGWDGPFRSTITARAVDALEEGRLLYAPDLRFELSEREARFLSPACLDRKSKNVSFRPRSGDLRGTCYNTPEREELRRLLERYYRRSSDLLHAICPEYADQLRPGFTTFRPAEIAGRTTSWRHDDTRLHVDAFPSRPMRGQRILRIFTNVHPQAPRVWRVGEPFEQIATRFLPRIRRPLPGAALLLAALRIVKGRRTEYDHLMLHIHDRMKANLAYQSWSPQNTVHFPPGATWACFTDWVSHAAMSGQFALEQTFYVPVTAMKQPQLSPLRVLERLTGRRLA